MISVDSASLFLLSPVLFCSTLPKLHFSPVLYCLYCSPTNPINCRSRSYQQVLFNMLRYVHRSVHKNFNKDKSSNGDYWNALPPPCFTVGLMLDFWSSLLDYRQTKVIPSEQKFWTLTASKIAVFQKSKSLALSSGFYFYLLFGFVCLFLLLLLWSSEVNLRGQYFGDFFFFFYS